MTLYLKYRPKAIDELDIDSVRQSLSNIFSGGDTPHAFLFSGPKGTGKTSAARIVAKIVNCENLGKNSEPCNKCGNCKSINSGNHMDVIEIDAASNRGVEDARNLKSQVGLAPSQGKKKVYIIDEAHMLTTDASNALLKTLEEPPSHVVFIMATTNPEKLIDTIRSRTTQVSFTKATSKETERSLTRVAKGEKLKVGSGVFSLISEASRGSFRDATKIMEQLVMEKIPLNKESVEKFLYKTDTGGQKLLESLVKKDAKGSIEFIENYVSIGADPQNLIDSLLTSLRTSLLAKVGVGEDTLSSLTRSEVIALIKLLMVASTESAGISIVQLPLEVAVVEWCGSGGPEKSEKKVQDLPEETKPEISVKEAPSGNGKKVEVKDEDWQRVLTLVKPINTGVEALLRAAKPVGFDGVTLTLGVYYKFHKERLEEVHHRRVVEEIFAEVIGVPVKLTCVLSEPRVVAKTVVLTEGEDKDIIKVAEEIFGN